MTISVNMLLGPFEEPYLPFALQSIDWADEIVLVYNNATPANEARVNDWRGSYKGDLIEVEYYNYYDKFDFCTARNLALDHSTKDFIFKVDADEVYFDSFKDTVNALDVSWFDAYKVNFFHLYFDLYHLAYTQVKDVLFKNSPELRWGASVHEAVQGVEKVCQLPDYFLHLGYVKAQPEIFKKWVLYSELEGDPDHYKGVDPNSILAGAVTTEFNGPYPEAVLPLLQLPKEKLPWEI